jgi:gluconolactonase
VAPDAPLQIPVATDPRFHDLVPRSARLDRLMSGATWAEGPVWLPADGSVVWSDVPNDRLLRWSPTGDSGVIETGAGFQNGHALDPDGRLLACEQGERRVSRQTTTGAWETVVDRIEGRRLNSPNDVVVKSDGSIWFSDPPYGIVSDWEGHRAEPELDGNFVFRFDPATGTVEVATGALEEPNGLAFSPDESVLYVSDTSAVLRRDGSGNHHIVAFDVIAGHSLANPRIFAVVTPGVPDGFTVDMHGNVFTSAGDGVHVLSPDGSRLGTIPIPERVGNCTFGGVAGDRLFITASTSLYAINLATRGTGTRRR